MEQSRGSHARLTAAGGCLKPSPSPPSHRAEGSLARLVSRATGTEAIFPALLTICREPLSSRTLERGRRRRQGWLARRYLWLEAPDAQLLHQRERGAWKSLPMRPCYQPDSVEKMPESIPLGKAWVTMNHTEGLGSGPQPNENTTWSPLAPEPFPWEFHTIIVVAIFCCVCLLHLSAFLYTICFQIQGHSRPAPRLASPGVYEENEIATFQPSPSATDTPARANPS